MRKINLLAYVIHPAVKSHITTACLTVFPFSSLLATPDRGTTVTDTFLGANTTSYAILRKEHDNLGSHYTSQTKVWLVESSKDPVAGNQEAKKTLLLDETNSLDAETMEVRKPEQNYKDSKINFADIIARYHITQLTQWSAEQIAELRFDSSTGRTEFKTQLLCELEKQKKTADKADDAQGLYQLIGVAEDFDCIFLTIGRGYDTDRIVSLVCIPPDISRNVRALRDMEPMYLSAGTYATAQEALARSKELNQTKNLRYGRKMEVWSVFHEDTGKTDYAVVLSESMNLIKDDHLGERQQGDPQWVPIVSDGFRELLPDPSP